VNVKQIIKNYLKENGFDGLCCNSCGCGLNNLFDCPSDGYENCKPAYKHTGTKNNGSAMKNKNGLYEWYSIKKQKEK